MGQKIITWQEFEKHIHFYDCWVLIQGRVYNVSDFLVQHPGGDSILLKHSGRDATAGFTGLPHSEYAISLKNSKFVGNIEIPQAPEGYLQRIDKAKKENMKKQKKKLIVRQQKISLEQVALHKSQQNCWIILEGKVYDCTDYLEQHPGGIGKIMEWAGKDATKAFRDANHSMSAMNTRDLYYIGELQNSKILLYVILLLLILGVGAFVLLN